MKTPMIALVACLLSMIANVSAAQKLGKTTSKEEVRRIEIQKKAEALQLQELLQSQNPFTWKSKGRNSLYDIFGLERNEDGTVKIVIPMDDAAKSQLVDAVRIETDAIESGKPIDDARLEYYAQLIDVATSLHDRRLLPHLTRRVPLETGSMVIDAIAEFGRDALPVVASAIDNPDYQEQRTVLALIVGRMLELSSVKDDQRSDAQKILAKLTDDDDPYVRAAAARGLGYADDGVAAPALEALKIKEAAIIAKGGDGSKLVLSEIDTSLAKLDERP